MIETFAIHSGDIPSLERRQKYNLTALHLFSLNKANAKLFCLATVNSFTDYCVHVQKRQKTWPIMMQHLVFYIFHVFNKIFAQTSSVPGTTLYVVESQSS